MQTFTWEKILGKLEEEQKRRTIVPLPDEWTLAYNKQPNVARLNFGTESLRFQNKDALRSVLRLMRAPASYLARIDGPAAQRNVDELRHNASQKLKLYLEVDPKDGVTEIRGVVPEKRSEVSDLDIFRSVYAKVPKNFVPELFYEDNKRTHIRLIDERAEAIGTLADGSPDSHSFGFDVVANELGWNQFFADAVGYRLICANGAIRRTGLNQPFFKRNYTGLTTELVETGAQAVAGIVPSYRDVYMNHMKAAKNLGLPMLYYPGSMRVPTTEFRDEVKKLLGVAKPGDKIVQDLATRVSAENDSTVYGLANALTFAAHGRPDRDLMETRAYTYLSGQVENAE
ncbi:MAG: hypothetical protein ACYDHY_07885 [Acidiferrobacterales bacterium]